MQGNELRHLALIARGTLPSARDAQGTVVAAVAAAASLADEAFGNSPGLRALSFVAPGIDRLLVDADDAPAALRGCVAAVAELEDAAARHGATLRICGRTEGLPGELTRHAAHPGLPPTDRTLLWFLRYGGRDEIARAASRFLQARPEATLGDDDLDAWLDTAGVPDPDLIVIAGGSFEAQDALVWQGSYAELWHTPGPWAAVTPEDLRRAILEFRTRQRRFGG